MPPVKRGPGRPPKHAPATKRRKLDSKDVEDDDISPSLEEWNRMAPYKRFELQHREDRYTFALNDVVMVLPPGHKPKDNSMNDDDFWMARIIEIRADDPTNVWVKVQWFYKPEELAGKIRGFDASVCGIRERIASDHEDILPSTCCEDVVTMRAYDASSLEQTVVPSEDEWYYRYTYRTRQTKGCPAITPPSTRTCIAKCKRGYNPDHDEMHICAPCSAAYHTSCLGARIPVSSLDWTTIEQTLPPPPPTLEPKSTSTPWRTPSPTSSQTLVEDMLSPGSDTANSETDTETEDDDSSKRTPKARKPKPQPVSSEAAVRVDPKLTALARLPLLKGAAHGVAGNCATVLAARRMLARAVVPSDWRSLLPAASGDLLRKLPGKRVRETFYECPGCGKPI